MQESMLQYASAVISSAAQSNYAMVHRGQIKIKQSRSTCLIWLLPAVVFDLLRLDPRLWSTAFNGAGIFRKNCTHLLSWK
jgi:hypothetical protein